MSYALQYDVPADEQFYRRVTEEIGDGQPKGFVAHLVVKRDGGLRHIEVWDSKEEWERFRTERIEPALDKVFAASGFARRPPRPRIEEMELVDVRVGTRTSSWRFSDPLRSGASSSTSRSFSTLTDGE